MPRSQQTGYLIPARTRYEIRTRSGLAIALRIAMTALRNIPHVELSTVRLAPAFIVDVLTGDLPALRFRFSTS